MAQVLMLVCDVWVQVEMSTTEALLELMDYAAAQQLMTTLQEAQHQEAAGHQIHQVPAAWLTSVGIRCSMGLGKAQEAQELIMQLITSTQGCSSSAVSEALQLLTSHCLDHPASLPQLLQVAVAALQAQPQDVHLPMAILRQILGTGDAGNPAHDDFALKFLADEQVQELIMQVSTCMQCQDSVMMASCDALSVAVSRSC
jgi:hypothetical protein